MRILELRSVLSSGYVTTFSNPAWLHVLTGKCRRVRLVIAVGGIRDAVARPGKADISSGLMLLALNVMSEVVRALCTSGVFSVRDGDQALR